MVNGTAHTLFCSKTRSEDWLEDWLATCYKHVSMLRSYSAKVCKTTIYKDIISRINSDIVANTYDV